LLKSPNAQRSSSDTGDLKLPDTAALKQLDELATKKLAEIIRRSSAGEQGWRGYDEGEVKAARELLALESPGVAK
jgi:hypothetical protein